MLFLKKILFFKREAAIQKDCHAVSTASKYKIRAIIFSEHLDCTLQSMESLRICHNIGKRSIQVFQWYCFQI